MAGKGRNTQKEWHDCILLYVIAVKVLAQLYRTEHRQYLSTCLQKPANELPRLLGYYAA
jgi:hypothetical protein